MTPPSAYAWPDVLSALIAGRDLTVEEAGWAMREILSGAATPSQIAGFAVALRAKGETVAEVEGLVATMYEFATPLRFEGRSVDIVGTGGDRSHTVNISTMAALVAAGAGVPVVKHGNRAASSSCGSADVLESLGIRLDLPPQRVEEVGGPLANPSRPAAQAVGVADPRMAAVIAGVLAKRGVEGFVFRGDDGLDELTTTTTSQVWSIAGGQVTTGRLDPTDVGVALGRPEDLRGGDVSFNTSVVHRLLDGEKGPVRDAVLLNAAAGIAAYDVGDGSLVDRIGAGLERAVEAVDSGEARRKLTEWVAAVAH